MHIIGKEEALKVEQRICPECGEEISVSYEGDGCYYCEDCGFQVEANALVWAK